MNSEEMKLYQRNYQREYRRKKREEMKRKRMENYRKEVVNEGGEVILPLKDFPGYCATNYGNIVSMKGSDGPRYLSQRTTKYGYRIVMLSLEGMLKSYQVARLVLSTFVGYPADPWLCVVNHKDGNTENCMLNNLEWLVCQTTDEYDPAVSHRRGVLKPESTRQKMTIAKFNQSRESREEGLITRQLTRERRKNGR